MADYGGRELQCLERHQHIRPHMDKVMGDHCRSCNQLPCVSSCAHDGNRTLVQLAPGWANASDPTAENGDAQSPWLIFECAIDDVCVNNYDTMGIMQQKCKCTEGDTEDDKLHSDIDSAFTDADVCYQGILCANCAPGYGLSQGLCKKCSDWAMNPLFVLAELLLAPTIIVMLYFLYLSKTTKDQRSRVTKRLRVMYQPSRILMGYGQVITQVGFVLNIKLPPSFDAIRRFLELLALDFRYLFQLDCLVTHFQLGYDHHAVDFYIEWTIRVFVVPAALLVAAVALSYFSKTGSTAKLQGSAFVILFILYPGICTDCFTLFSCRDLDENVELLYFDFRVDCLDPLHSVFRWISTAVIAVFALGIPSTMIYLTLKRVREHKRSSKADRIVCRRVAEELQIDDEEVVAEAIADVYGSGGHPFLVNAYKNRFFYWEGVDMLRKLVVVGLLVLAGRGSATQLFLGIMVSVLALCLQIHYQPFRHDEDNVFKTMVDFNILLLMVMCLVLRNYDIHCAAVEPDPNRTSVTCIHGDIDLFDESIYDWILVVSFFCSIGGGFCWSIDKKRKLMREIDTADTPMAKKAELIAATKQRNNYHSS
jgi:hypothetical protein